MKFECLKEKLEEIVTGAGRASSKKTSLPILEGVYLSAQKNKVTVRGTNLDVGIEKSISAKVSDSGSVVVNADIISRFLNSLSSDTKINVEKKEDVLYINSGSVNTKIKTLPSDDFPTLPKLEKQKPTKIDPKKFSEGLKSVWYSASPGSLKPELSSVYVLNKTGIFVFAATDSFRLAEKKIFGIKTDSFEEVLIPFKNVPEILKFFEENQSGSVDMKASDSQMSFSGKDTYITTRVVDGNFPDYKQIIPKEYTTEVVVLKRDILDALKTTNVFANKFNQIYFSIDPKDKEFTVKTENDEIGFSSYKIKSTITGEGIDISFNFKYVVDCFQSIPQDSVKLKLSGIGKPMVISGVGDDSFSYLVMPMNR